YEPLKSLSQLSRSLKALAERVSPAVVEIEIDGYGTNSEHANSPYTRQRAIGSGVIVSSDGYIVTNAHVIKGARRIRISLTPSDAFTVTAALQNDHVFDARIIGANEDTDLAVLKIDANNMPTLALAKYDD